MSLSKFIELPDVKAKFKQESEKPRFSIDKPLLAPVITSNPPKIGTAFDYLLRFYANYLNPNAVSNQWVAEASLGLLNDIKDNDTVLITPNFRLGKAPDAVDLTKGFIENCKELKYQCHSEAKLTIETAKKNLRSYLKTGKMGDKLIASALDLAKLDVLWRAGYLHPKKRSKPDKNDMEDLRNLISIINPETIKADHTCVLNPIFGPKATKLMSADGDIVIDDILIDIKTVKNLKVDRSIFNQLIGYYTLYRIGGIRGMPSSNQINKLGVYFSRHGYLHTYQVEDIINESTYLDFIEWFKQRAFEFGLP